ncbi:MAG: putative DNA-binding protein [Actinomycetia bacterium]|nr:putative DNA-binding protein [Actinomycetes bacterium]
MPTYTFEVRFTGPAGGDALIDALYEAGWSDATISFDPDTGGAGEATFDRDAQSAVDAITSAIDQGRRCGLDLTGVSDDTVTLGEIAERVGRTLAAVDYWVKGRRGPGGFPAPRVPRDRAALRSWADVAEWVAVHQLANISPEDIEVAQVSRAMDAVLRARHQVSEGVWEKIVTAVAAVVPLALDGGMGTRIGAPQRGCAGTC